MFPDADQAINAQIQAPNQYISGFEGGEPFFGKLIEQAKDLKAFLHRYVAAQPLAGKVFTSIFLNPSLRTRTSFESAVARLGGHMIVLEPGATSWGWEFEDGVVMDGNKAEHIKEAAAVLSSYSDIIGMRAFASMDDFGTEMLDGQMKALAEYATVPVISLESARYHPCQALADALTLTERFGAKPQGKKFTLTWATHPKMCGVAVPHSTLLTAARLGMDVTLAHPEGYDLHPEVVAQAAGLAEAQGGGLSIVHDMDDACQNAEVVYAKAWGSPLDYGDKAAGAARNAEHGHWTVSEAQMAKGNDAAFMHCLPVRRGVVVDGAVLDSPASLVQRQAANRMWAQMALLMKMVGA